jgi:hypothetical protein
MYVYVFRYAYICVCVCVYVYIYIYIYIYIYAFMQFFSRPVRCFLLSLVHFKFDFANEYFFVVDKNYFPVI